MKRVSIFLLSFFLLLSQAHAFSSEKIYAPATAKKISQKLEYFYTSNITYGNFLSYGLYKASRFDQETILVRSHASYLNSKKLIPRL